MSASLDERLGGETGIAALVEDTINAHLANPVVQTRFQNAKDIEHAKKMAREFFGAGAGYMAVMDDIMSALQKHGIDPTTQKDVLAIIYSLKGEIIRT